MRSALWPIANILNDVQRMTTAETISQGSQPCQGGDGAMALAFGTAPPRSRIPDRAPAPDLQEQQGDDQRAERGQHVGQRIIEIVGGDELRQREAAAGDQQHRPQRATERKPP